MLRKRNKFGIIKPYNLEDTLPWHMHANLSPKQWLMLRDNVPASTPDIHEAMADLHVCFDIRHPQCGDHNAWCTKAS